MYSQFHPSCAWLVFAALALIQLTLIPFSAVNVPDGSCCESEHGSEETGCSTTDCCSCGCHGVNPVIATAAPHIDRSPVASLSHCSGTTTAPMGVSRSIERPPEVVSFPV